MAEADCYKQALILPRPSGPPVVAEANVANKHLLQSDFSS